MPRDVTVTFDDGSTHEYKNAPDTATPEQITERAQKDFSGKRVTALDGGKKGGSPTEKKEETPKSMSAGDIAKEVALTPFSGAEAGLHIASEMVAKPVSDIAGMAATAYDAIKNDKDNEGSPSAFQKHVQESFIYEPRGKAGQFTAEGVDKILSLPGRAASLVTKPVGNAIRGDSGSDTARGAIGNFTEESGNQLAQIALAKYAPVAIKATADTAKTAAQAAADRLAPPTRTLLGKDVAPAKEEAAIQAKTAVEKAIEGQKKVAEQEQANVAKMEKERAAIDDFVSKPMKNSAGETVPSHQQNGIAIDASVKTAWETAKKTRSEGADADMAALTRVARAKEAAGEYVDTKEVVKPLEELKEAAKGIKGLEGQVDDMIAAVQNNTRSASEAKPTGPAKEVKRGSSTRVEEQTREQWLKHNPNATTQEKQARFMRSESGTPKTDTPKSPPGKSFQQLEVTRRYLNDIAYSGALEGYSSIVKNAAREAVKRLDASMQAFAPKEFGEYKNNYAQRSKPLEAMDSRLGKVLTGSSGGIGGDAYSNVAKEKLPGRILSTADGQEMMVDVLSGGKPPAESAAPEVKAAYAKARAEAERTVGKMTENYITEDLRGKTGKQMQETLNSPKMRPTTENLPSDIKNKMQIRATNKANLEEKSDQLGKSLDEANKRAQEAKDKAEKMQTLLKMSNDLASFKDQKFIKQAQEGYQSIIDDAVENGTMTHEQRKAAKAYLSKANTLEEQTARYQRIAKKITLGTTTLFIGKEIAK